MKKILVTEDSAAMRGLIVSTLEEMQCFEVVEACNGFEALRALPREKVDLIITDINMPDINGLDLVSFCRTNPLYQQTPVIIISTEGSERDREKGLALGANAYLIKPFQPEELQQVVRHLLD
ncbi:response regulator [Geopsychrobacter electrodiphilus]|uniref:response regulator n=1 Tax=Geopsychrobacter electrodiphilus TaxID=225196 RepID=UPI00035D9E7E|nr:response regulator [Geopsychrobacter electrodiphilus]